MNAVLTIRPYRDHGTWVFDDPAAGLVREPFVAGVPEMIDELVRDIPGAERGFRMLFSTGPFPGATRFEWVREEGGGNWYRWPEHGGEGWLCPALFKYFDRAPRELYAKAEPLDAADQDTIAIPLSHVRLLRELLEKGDVGSALAMVKLALGER